VYDINHIQENISKSNTHELGDNFVASAAQFNKTKDKFDHTGIVICCDGELKVFHFDGHNILLDNIKSDEWYFDKKLDFVYSDEVEGFLSFCERIREKSNPRYGFNYNGSFFKPDGQYFSEVQDHQFMTCVGFCLNVITGYIENHEYLFFDDWNMIPLEQDYYFTNWEEASDVLTKDEMKELKKKQRRVYPLEFLCSAFINSLPIRKVDIETLKPLIIQSVKNKIVEEQNSDSKSA
jgi:hypothetical protein